MDFEFTPEQEAWRAEVRAFFARVIPLSLQEEMEARGEDHSDAAYQALADAGYTGISIPKEYGGQGRSYFELAIFAEEATLAGAPAQTMSLFNSSVHWLGNAVVRIGTEEQRRRILPGVLDGSIRMSLGLTEPGAGSDLAAVRTRAVLDGDDFLVNGEKIYNSADVSSHIITVLRTDPEAPKHKGISLLLIELACQGIAIAPLQTIGGRVRNVVRFQEVRVPRANLLGRLNNGWYDLMSVMDLERSNIASPAILKRLLDGLVEYCRQTEVDGQPLSDNPDVRDRLATMAREARIARLFAYRTSWGQTAGRDVTAWEAPMSKLYASEAEERFANAALDILGPAGELAFRDAGRAYAPLLALARRLYLDARINQIAGGASEIQRNIIAQRGLGLPR